MAKNYVIKLKDSEPVIYVSAVITYRNLMLSKKIDDSIASRLLNKANDSRIKLTPFELKHLIKAVQIQRNQLIVNESDTSDVDCFLKKLLELNERDKER